MCGLTRALWIQRESVGVSPCFSTFLAIYIVYCWLHISEIRFAINPFLSAFPIALSYSL